MAVLVNADQSVMTVGHAMQGKNASVVIAYQPAIVELMLTAKVVKSVKTTLAKKDAAHQT
jgi:hypothetical protein